VGETPPPAHQVPASHRSLRGPQGAVGETPPPAQPAPASHRSLRGPQGACGGDAAACAASPPAPLSLSPEWLKAFLAEFEDVVCPSKVLPPVGTDVEHHIKTTGPPIASRFRRLDAEKLAAAKAESCSWRRTGSSGGQTALGHRLYTW
jgi:hypothetical protein